MITKDKIIDIFCLLNFLISLGNMEDTAPFKKGRFSKENIRKAP
jgi:hypothetical protein